MPKQCSGFPAYFARDTRAFFGICESQQKIPSRNYSTDLLHWVGDKTTNSFKHPSNASHGLLSQQLLHQREGSELCTDPYTYCEGQEALYPCCTGRRGIGYVRLCFAAVARSTSETKPFCKPSHSEEICLAQRKTRHNTG